MGGGVVDDYMTLARGGGLPKWMHCLTVALTRMLHPHLYDGYVPLPSREAWHLYLYDDNGSDRN